MPFEKHQLFFREELSELEVYEKDVLRKWLQGDPKKFLEKIGWGNKIETINSWSDKIK